MAYLCIYTGYSKHYINNIENTWNILFMPARFGCFVGNAGPCLTRESNWYTKKLKEVFYTKT